MYNIFHNRFIICCSGLFFFVMSTVLAFAQPTLQGIADTITGLFAFGLIPLAMALLFLFFFWNIAVFLFREGDYKKRAKERLLWSIVWVFMLFSLYGFVIVLRILFTY